MGRINYFLQFSLGLFIFFACDQMPEPDDISTTEATEAVDGARENKFMLEKEDEKQSIKEQKERLIKDGFQVFEMVNPATNDTLIMQQYFLAFLKKGPNRDQDEEESKKLQEEHLTHLRRMYEMGYADISGPLGDAGDLMGITIYNVPTLEMADSLANSDPMVKAQRLKIEVHPWWAAKGFKLR